jgi:hypothetical protein
MSHLMDVAAMMGIRDHVGVKKSCFLSHSYVEGARRTPCYGILSGVERCNYQAGMANMMKMWTEGCVLSDDAYRVVRVEKLGCEGSRVIWLLGDCLVMQMAMSSDQQVPGPRDKEVVM